MAGSTLKIRMSRIYTRYFNMFATNSKKLRTMFKFPDSYGGDYIDLDIKSFSYDGKNTGIKEFQPIWFSNQTMQKFIATMIPGWGLSVVAQQAAGNKPMTNIIVDFNQWKEEFRLKGIITPDNPSASNANKNIMDKWSKLRYWMMNTTSGQSADKMAYTMGLMLLYDPNTKDSGVDSKGIPYGQPGDIWLGRLASLPSGNFSAAKGKFEYTIKWKTGVVILA